jgi:oligopeptide transport system ATP-binding protein
MKPLIEVQDLAVSYDTYAGEVQSVRGVSFRILKGQTVALVGESGCGKSVTAKSLMGLIEKPGRVKEGSRIFYEGEEISGYDETKWNGFRGKEISMILQDALVSLNPTMRIGKQIKENLSNHFPKIGRQEQESRAVEMLRKAGIPDAELCMGKYPHELSGGMRQRVMIAMAMITKPKMLIADEPTTSLDVTIQAQILELMQELQEETGMSILMITHDMGVVADIADEIIVMYAGKIAERGSCREIFYHPWHPYTWSLLNSVPRIDAARGQKLAAIEGNIPDMTLPPKGCGFCERCPYAMNVCREYMPDGAEVREGHEVWCWLTDDRADKSGLPFRIERNFKAKEAGISESKSTGKEGERAAGAGRKTDGR